MQLGRAAREILEAALDAVLPPRERLARTKRRHASDIPLETAVHELLGERLVTIADYRTEAVRDMIGSLKYDGSAHAAQIAADLLADYLREEIAAERAFSKKQVLIAPVPLHTRRQRERGFNQIERVLALLPADMREGPLAALAPSLLLRARETLQQARLSRQERLSNVAGAFSLAGTAPERGTRVFLVDDVATTGATLVNAAAPLKRAGARVFLIALARA